MKRATAFTIFAALAGSCAAADVTSSQRPYPRPPLQAEISAARVTAPAISSNSLAVSQRPIARPGTRSTAPNTQQPKQAKPVEIATTGKSRRICGDRAIRGERVSDIAGKLPGCGVSDPVRVTEVSGVRLSQGAVMDCPTAEALNAWVEDSVKPTFGRLGGGISSMRVAAHYNCRTRNNQAGAKISEHGKGRAIDISAFTLENGKTITVLDGWNDRVDGKILKRLHADACGPFKTVLGPKADRFHQDHFHFDTARRSGRYCR